MVKKEFTPQELKNSKRIFKSATPKYTVDWYLKWIASLIILVAMSMRGIPELMMYDMYLSIVGVTLWTIVSIMWKDRALILVNGVGCLLLVKTVLTQMLAS